MGGAEVEASAKTTVFIPFLHWTLGSLTNNGKTVLMRDRKMNTFCVACTEIDKPAAAEAPAKQSPAPASTCDAVPTPPKPAAEQAKLAQPPRLNAATPLGTAASQSSDNYTVRWPFSFLFTQEAPDSRACRPGSACGTICRPRSCRSSPKSSSSLCEARRRRRPRGWPSVPQSWSL
jgi:hypothetical protein